MADTLREFSDATLEIELGQPGPPVLVDLWAPWCGSCRFLAPAVETVAEEWVGRLRVGKLDVDAFPRAAHVHGVHSVPTLLLFVDGAEVLRLDGVRSKATLINQLEPYLGRRGSLFGLPEHEEGTR